MNDFPEHVRGNLDVPASVWVDHREIERDLPTGLVVAYTSPGGFILDATGLLSVAAGFSDRRYAPLLPKRPREMLAVLADAAGTVDLIAAWDDTVEVMGWWPAAVTGLRSGGHVAVICASGDVGRQSSIIAGASAAGLGFIQHLVVATPEALDDAAAAEAAPVAGRRSSRRRFRRRHWDVYMFRHPHPLARGVARRAAA